MLGKELLRCKKIYAAVDKASAAYDGHLFCTIFIGVMGACGGGIVKYGIACVKSGFSSIKDHSTSQ